MCKSKKPQEIKLVFLINLDKKMSKMTYVLAIYFLNKNSLSHKSVPNPDVV